MLLSVIIPQYRETDDVVKRLLSSIEYQLGVDFNNIEVIVVNDGSDVLLSDDMLNSFKNIKPKYIKLEKNVGPGLARQAGLDVALGEYVTFCDADDIYQNFGVFSLYFDEIAKNKPDILSTSWLEELKINNTLNYLTHKIEATWMHGKIFNHSFLQSNDIRFSDKLFYHEDSYFLSNAFSSTTNIRHVDVITYVWLWGNDSITRRNNGSYTYEAFVEFLTAIELSMQWLAERTPVIIPNKILNVLMYTYCTLQSVEWEQKYITDCEDKLKQVYTQYAKEFATCTVEDVSNMYVQERNKITMPYIEKETFTQFIRRLLGLDEVK